MTSQRPRSMKTHPHFVISLFIAITGTTTLFGQSRLPDYTNESDFLFAGPASWGNGLFGFWNPALASMISGPEMEFIVSDHGIRSWTASRWGFFTGIPHFGFGLFQQRTPSGDDPADEIRVTDCRMSMGFGNEAFSLGIGYGWPAGSGSGQIRDRSLSAGWLVRPNRFVSIGVSGMVSLQGGDKTGLIDLGWRPLGNDRITLKADLAPISGHAFKDSPWALGAVVQPLEGIHVTGQYFKDHGFSIGLALDLGISSIFAKSRSGAGNDPDERIMGLRIGSDRKGVLNRLLDRRPAWVEMDLSGPVTYRKYLLFDSGGRTLLDIVSALDRAAIGPGISGICLNLSGIRAAPSLIWEIRERLLAVRARGKQVVVFLDRGQMSEYHLASAADRIVLDPQGQIFLKGYVLGRTYFRGTLEKLGLGFEEWRFFAYKSAMESYSRNSFSEPDREQFQTLADAFYETAVEDIRLGRNMTRTAVDSLIREQAIFMADDALAEGLVDTLGRWIDREQILRTLESRPFRTIRPGDLTSRVFEKRPWGGASRIALLYALGACDMDSGIRARTLSKAILDAASDPGIRAVVLRVDSPGGDGLASDWVAEAMKKCSSKKPVIVSQGNLAASGGYWISMRADSILASPVTLTGSIGVIGGWLWNKGFGEKLGITSDRVQAGAHADLGFGITLPLFGVRLPDRNLTEDEHMRMESAIRLMYRDFVGKVASSRNLDYRKVKEIAQGRIWPGKTALTLGLVDRIGGLADALSMAKKATHIPSNQIVDVVEFPKTEWFNPDLFSGPSFRNSLETPSAMAIGECLRTIARFPGFPLPMMPLDFLPGAEESPDLNLPSHPLLQILNEVIPW